MVSALLELRGTPARAPPRGADPDPDEKVAWAIDAARAWRGRSLSLGARSDLRPMPERPGRPDRRQSGLDRLGYRRILIPYSLDF